MIELHAKNGYILTNGEIYARDVYLSNLDAAENWREVPEDSAPTEGEGEKDEN